MVEVTIHELVGNWNQAMSYARKSKHRSLRVTQDVPFTRQRLGAVEFAQSLAVFGGPRMMIMKCAHRDSNSKSAEPNYVMYGDPWLSVSPRSEAVPCP